ncbi:hypothetical protein [Variovorax sp. N23]|uniref:hypothetical protein n=1 Tax=Variovorax sp. N23 TaxID=2980555 RepID=UPI0021C7638C|nr:hypothetical protein [Variovorax sp. N23]MCU4121998.1 hypothetical protein [Variovorax sp. N23]
MGNIDFSTIGLVIAVATGIGSFFLGRRLSRGRTEKKQQKARAAEFATQSRQVRRARERSARK